MYVTVSFYNMRIPPLLFFLPPLVVFPWVFLWTIVFSPCVLWKSLPCPTFAPSLFLFLVRRTLGQSVPPIGNKPTFSFSFFFYEPWFGLASFFFLPLKRRFSNQHSPSHIPLSPLSPWGFFFCPPSHQSMSPFST